MAPSSWTLVCVWIAALSSSLAFHSSPQTVPSAPLTPRRCLNQIPSFAAAVQCAGRRTGSEMRAASTAVSEPSAQTKAVVRKEWDIGATAKYLLATALQWACILVTLAALDRGMPLLPSSLPSFVPTALTASFFALMAVRSRLFSVLNNQRPTPLSERKEIAEGTRPSWMPPPIVFPFVWGTIAMLRTLSSTLIWRQAGAFLTPPIAALMLHLSIGDTWNTIQNVDRRRGTAASVVLLVLASSIAANRLYFAALPIAGWILLPQTMWLSVATVLVCDIWRLNGCEPLYPVKREMVS